MKTTFKKLGYCFSVESAMIENATFPYEAALSKTNVMTNRMEGTDGSSAKNRILPLDKFFFFLKIPFHFGNILQIVDLMYRLPKPP